MSAYAVRLYEVVIEEYFGVSVAKVVASLLSVANVPVPLLAFRTHLPVYQIKKSLCVLIQHGLVTFSLGDKAQPIYNCDKQAIEAFIQAPRCILTIKTLYGEYAEAIAEELVAHGQLTCSQCINRVSGRLEIEGDKVKEKFARMAETQFVIRCCQVSESKPDDICPRLVPPTDPFVLPDEIHVEKDSGETSRKRKLDSDIYWCLNYNKFSLYFRDELLLKMIRNTSNEQCEKAVRAMLKLSELKSSPGDANSSPLPMNDILRSANKWNMGLTKAMMDQSLAFLTDEQSRLLRKVGDSGGGIYAIDFERAAEIMCRTLVESVIREKFDTKGVRIFRLLLEKGYLEQNTIESLSMLPNKEGKELLYLLLNEKFVFVKQVSKTGDFAPVRTFYLFYVDLEKVARMMHEQCYKTLTNLILRRRFEIREQRPLIERQEKVDTIIANIQSDESIDEDSKCEQISEVEQAYLTANEKQSLEHHRRSVLALQRAEMQIEQTLFILGLYIDYRNRRV